MMVSESHRSLKPSCWNCGNCGNCGECRQPAESLAGTDPQRSRKLARLGVHGSIKPENILWFSNQCQPSSSPSPPLVSIDRIPWWANQQNFGNNPDVRNDRASDSEDAKPKLQVFMPSGKPWMKQSSTVSQDQSFKLSGSLQKPSDHNFATMMQDIPAVISKIDKPSYIPLAILKSYWSRGMVEKTFKSCGKSQEIAETKALLKTLGGKPPRHIFENGNKRAMRILATLAMFGGVSAAAISSLYRHLQDDPGHKTWTSKDEVTQSLPWEMQTPVQSLRPKTTLTLLMGALGAYGSSTGNLYYRQRHNPRNDMFLICGVCAGLVVGSVYGLNVQEIIFRLLPIFALTGILAVYIFPPGTGEAIITLEYVA